MDLSPNTQLTGLAIPVEGIHTREERLNPFPWFAKMRQTSPVTYDERRSSWDLFRYDDIVTVLKDPATFSSVRPTAGPVLLGSIIGMDPPKHHQMRNIVSKAFTPKAISELEPRIAEIVHELANPLKSKQQMDLIHDISYPLPVIVIAELLGVPPEDRRLFKDWSDVIVKMPEDNTETEVQSFFQERQKTRQELDDYFMNVVTERRKNPREDLITRLVHAEVDGQHLTDQEIMEFCILLLAAGNETTTNLISNAIRKFIEEPHLQEHLRQHPTLMEKAVEEVLRFYSPVLATNRVVTKDTEIGGRKIKKGDQVIVWIASANRDENKFPEAAQFKVDRSPNPHLAFGNGAHFCLGAPLARLEARVALPIILSSFHNMEFPERTELTPIPSTFVYGVKSLPVKYIPTTIH